ncbi:hypothetical protein EUA60_02230 [TM7 phylum sp. oral taxon 346]|nr:hypothetical protein EUA60_02230 [TM7 phylum sp. oral taxon 346]
MFIVGMISWWYSVGWKRAAVDVWESIERLYDTFSLGLLLKTLFAPWRQISAGKVRGPIGVQLRAFFDRLVSRIIGGFIRTITLMIGVVALCVMLLIGLLRLAIWPLIPFMPAAMVIAAISGWIPCHL